tara:strand:- start:5645 stop:5836 length:192 start_codon:yes stop_codon:yes gene_type:complete
LDKKGSEWGSNLMVCKSMTDFRFKGYLEHMRVTLTLEGDVLRPLKSQTSDESLSLAVAMKAKW